MPKGLFLVLFASLLRLSAAQTPLPSCAQTCVGTSVSQVGCSIADLACYCNKSNFLSGIRDCANQACNRQDADTAISWVNTQCANAGVGTTNVLGVVTTVSRAASAVSQVASVVSQPGVATSQAGSALSSITGVAGTARQSTAPSSAISGPSPSISSTIISPGTSISSPTSATTAPPSDAARSDGGLSTGAKAGIGAAVPLALLILGALVFIFWRRRRTPQSSNMIESAQIEGHDNHSGLLVPAYEHHHSPTKPELESNTVQVKPELADTSHTATKQELASPAPAFKSELSETPVETSPLPPTYERHHAPHDREFHELPTASSPIAQPAELQEGHATLEDVGPAIVIPTPYREEDSRLEQLRAQRAAVMRDRERKEEIDRMRAEEERLDRAIAELESRRS